MKEVMLWNKDKTKAVRASCIQVLTLNSKKSSALGLPLVIKGWFNTEDSFTFGEFPSEEKAREFMTQLCKLIEDTD